MIVMKNKGVQYLVKLSLILLCFFMIQGNTVIVKAESRMIQYNGKKYNYTNGMTKIEVNEMEMSTPFGGIILNNTALVPAYYIYKQSELDVMYQYDKKNKKIYLENLDHQIEFPVGQKYAYIDGKKEILEQAAIVVKDIKTGKSCVMVPGRVSANGLGYHYKWDAERRTSCITEQKEEIKEDENTEEIEETEEEEVKLEDELQDEDNQASENLDDKDSTIPDDYVVKIPKPSHLKVYEEDDNYWEKVYTIRLDQDYSDFYNHNKIEQKKSSITKMLLTTQNDKTEIKFYTNKIQAFRITDVNDTLYVEVGNPKDIYEKIVVIDAGHGGTDPGMTGNGITEKNKTLEIVKAAKKYFDTNKDIKVYYTRLADTVPHVTAGSTGVKNSSMSLAPRYNLANDINADLFISVHVNSWINSSVNGTETLYSSSNNRTNSFGMSSKDFANMLHKDMLKVIGRADRGVKIRNNLAVLCYTKMPAILIETAFATNKKDAEVLNTKVDEMAKAIYNVTVRAFQ